MAKGSPFGEESRREILNRHFAERPVTVDRAWEFVYRELLWVDGSTGLAHLYESDKVQPGRSAWYERAVRFTDALCREFGGVSRQQLKLEIDRLFREALQRLIGSGKQTSQQSEIAEAVSESDSTVLPRSIVRKAQRAASQKPVSAADPELIVEFAQLLGDRLGTPPKAAEAVAQELVGKARYYFTVERKRQNILGHGFEDILQLLVSKLTTIPASQIRMSTKAFDLPGFSAPHKRERFETPDLAVVVGHETKLLASVKWSLRQDRQKQLSDELDCYAALLSQDAFPRYVLITNEYDPGRLVNTNALSRRGHSVSCIYHVNPSLLRDVLSDGQKYEEDLLPLVQSGRLRSISDFLIDIEKAYGTYVPQQPLTADQKRELRRRKR